MTAPAPEATSDRSFVRLAAGQQEAEVSRAIALLDAARSQDIKLSAVALTRELGYEQRSPVNSGLQRIKKLMPRVKSDGERLSQAIDALHQQALWEDAERTTQSQLEAWFAKLSDEQRASLALLPRSAGDADMASWDLAVLDGSGARFALGRVVGLPDSVLASLTPDERSAIEERRLFWASLGLTSGAAIDAFIKEHFRKETVHSRKRNPAEIDWLLAQRPEAQALFDELQREGIDVSLLKCTRTPDPVSDSIRHIAVKSQHKFVTTWLPQLLRNGVQPQILDRDIAAVNHGYDQLARVEERLAADKPFQNLLLTELFARQRAVDLDFDRSVQMISRFQEEVLQLQADGLLTTRQNRTLNELNQILRQGLGTEYAHRRLLQDDANRTSEGAQAIIKLLAFLAPATEVLQNVAHLGGVATVLAATTDDVAGGAAAMSALKGAGVSNDEIFKRLRLLIPAGIAAMVLAGFVEKAQKTVSPRIAGIMFSSAAVLLSAVTSAVSVKYFADGYETLAMEGKLPGSIPSDPHFVQQLRKLNAKGPTEDEITATIDGAIQAAGLRGLGHERIMRQIRQHMEKEGFKALLRAAESPGAWKRYAAGLKEACGVNPAQRGLAFGTLTAPLFGALFGPLFLTSPLAYAVAGSYETICGAATIYGYNWTAGARWRHHVNKQTKSVRNGSSGLMR